MTGFSTVDPIAETRIYLDGSLERERFLRRHLHLIVPELHAPALIAQRDADLLRAGWEAASAQALEQP